MESAGDTSPTRSGRPPRVIHGVGRSGPVSGVWSSPTGRYRGAVVGLSTHPLRRGDVNWMSLVTHPSPTEEGTGVSLGSTYGSRVNWGGGKPLRWYPFIGVSLQTCP